MTQKNTLAAQQFDFADRLSTYNAQVKQFNESLARFNEEKNEFQLLKQKLETEKQEAEKRQAELEETKAELERQKTEAEKSRLENDKKHLESLAEFQEKSAALDRQTTELKERELDLESRENALNAARREFNSRRYAAGYAAPADQFYTSPAPYTAAAAGYAEGGRNGPLSQTPVQSAPFAEKQEQRIDFGDLHERARTDGIQIKTAGSMGGKPKAAGDNFAPVFNKGLTLFKAALIAFCIVIAESLAVFFVKDKIGVSGLYPAIGCGAGFLAFLVCTIMYACGYRPQARRSKHPAYILNASILFVIAVIAVTMIAVYLKVDLKQPAELLKYVLLPVAYLLNLVFFAVFYYLFSLNSKNSAAGNE